MYGWLLNSIDREYAVIHVLKDSPRGSVRLIRHKALGKRLILRRFQGSGEVYRQLMGYVCGNPLQIYETAEQDGEVLVLEEFEERFLSKPLPSVVAHLIVGQRMGQTKIAKTNPLKMF